MNDQETSKNSTPEKAPQVTVKSHPGFETSDIEKHKGIACLSYIFLLFLVPLLTENESKFAQFHAKQGMSLFIVWVVTDLVLNVIPMFGVMLLPIANLFFIIVSAIGVLKTLRGEAWEIPGMSLITKKLNP
ncbi:MAG: DUF4870 domain-containing protein [Candidatus Moranbacteria bacterium]|jgi:uncharacterized membrane protein|nr:DUF4870 domain-containing protein [Candidatus Moranbacteria bacterium]MBP9801342.1 DUF4870 domain-containing protein [Candidatus Moranbacteria bacterium]